MLSLSKRASPVSVTTPLALTMEEQKTLSPTVPSLSASTLVVDSQKDQVRGGQPLQSVARDHQNTIVHISEVGLMKIETALTLGTSF